jgi:hypothetical protein
MWPLADESKDAGSDIREALFGRRRHVYRILFRIEGNVVRILRVRHASQDRLVPEDLE